MLNPKTTLGERKKNIIAMFEKEFTVNEKTFFFSINNLQLMRKTQNGKRKGKKKRFC